jgi:hypothetical protein
MANFPRIILQNYITLLLICSLFKLQVCIPAFMKHSPILQIHFAYLFRIVLELTVSANKFYYASSVFWGMLLWTWNDNRRLLDNSNNHRRTWKYLISTDAKKPSSDLNVPLTFISLELLWKNFFLARQWCLYNTCIGICTEVKTRKR